MNRHTIRYALILVAALAVAALAVARFDGLCSIFSTVWSAFEPLAIGAVLAYLLQMVSYVILRKKMPDIKRPFTSPFGVPGAVIAGLLAFCIFVAVLLNPDYRLAVYAMVVIYVLATIFFAVYGRKHLVLSPEEEFAASGGKVAYKTED